MLQAILRFSIHNRWLVVLLTAVAALVGANALRRLPIDAVPDITNVQVQINALAPSLSPIEIEKQVTFPIENALAGIPGLQSTRSLSRNGFAQVTAVFEDDVNIFFARQQVSEQMNQATESLPPGVEPIMGPIATGLGEVFMWTVEYGAEVKGQQSEISNQNEGRVAHGGLTSDLRPLTSDRPGPQPDGSYLTPEGRRLTTELERAAYLREVQDWIIRPQIRTVKDVAGVDAIGGYVKQYHVQPDPMKLVSYGLTFNDVIEALERNNLSTGAGYVEHHGETYLVRATGRIEHVDQLADIVVGTRHGIPIRVRDVVHDDPETPGTPGTPGIGVGRELRTGSASENGREVVVGTAIMLMGANSRTVAAAVEQRMQAVQASLPPGIVARPVLNRTSLVDATIRTVRNNLLEGAILVIVVLLLMLGNIRAALICAAAIPLSMLFAAWGMVQSKVSGNLMSLGAIDFGLIVDGAVIIVENCLRRLGLRQHREGRLLTLAERLHEVMAASREMLRPSVYGQAIIIIVYVPILTLTGIEGKMFHPMAMTVIFALLGALALSLTFVPAMVALVIRGRVQEREMAAVRWARSAYEPALRWALRARWAVVPAAVVAFAASLMLFARLGQEFIPQLNERNIAMHAIRIPSTSLTQATAMQLDVERAIAEFPEVELVFSKTGTAELAFDSMPPHVSDTFIILKDEDQWRSEAELDRLIAAKQQEQEQRGAHAGHGDAHDDHAHDAHGHGPHAHGHEVIDLTDHKGKLITLLELTLREVPGNNYEFSQPIQMRFNELIAGVRGDVAIKVYGDDFDALRAVADQILAQLQTIPGVADAKVEQTTGLPVMTVDIDRQAIARYGLTIAQVQDVVAAAMGGRTAGQVFEGDRRFDLVVRLPESLRARMDTLDRLMISLPDVLDESDLLPAGGGLGASGLLRPTSHEPDHDQADRRLARGFVPLGVLARIDVAEGANQISRENGKRRVVVQCNVRGRDLGSFVEQAQQAIADVPLPPGSWIDWGGQYEHLVAARQRLSLVVPACLALIGLLLIGLFRSLRDALLVFSAVPLALTGGILALWLRGLPFSISAAVGFIALSGVAVLNGLVMISAVNQLRGEGLPRDEALFRGCMTRLRPVLMTALVASLGFVPMALTTGTGAEVQRPLATVVIGGLITSTLLTLLVLPALYRMFSRNEEEPILR